ncbi:RNA chaperone Hfq [Cupriavidus necator]|uniref:RNA chaperone Hfq n=1 Tax=Cupriavidus necator TaxID=106590 RepID=UPI00339D67DB
MKKKEIRPRQTSRKQLQYQQLALHADSRAPVVVHLSNGTRLQGTVLAMDNYMLLLGRQANDTQPTLVYKQAIALITPTMAPGDPDVPALPAPTTRPDFVPIYIPRTRKRR